MKRQLLVTLCIVTGNFLCAAQVSHKHDNTLVFDDANHVRVKFGLQEDGVRLVRERTFWQQCVSVYNKLVGPKQLRLTKKEQSLLKFLNTTFPPKVLQEVLLPYMRVYSDLESPQYNIKLEPEGFEQFVGEELAGDPVSGIAQVPNGAIVIVHEEDRRKIWYPAYPEKLSRSHEPRSKDKWPEHRRQLLGRKVPTQFADYCVKSICALRSGKIAVAYPTCIAFCEPDALFSSPTIIGNTRYGAETTTFHINHIKELRDGRLAWSLTNGTIVIRGSKEDDQAVVLSDKDNKNENNSLVDPFVELDNGSVAAAYRDGSAVVWNTTETSDTPQKVTRDYFKNQPSPFKERKKNVQQELVMADGRVAVVTGDGYFKIVNHNAKGDVEQLMHRKELMNKVKLSLDINTKALCAAFKTIQDIYRC